MPTKQYAVTMARYNAWQNDNLIGAASTLGDDARQEDRGAFFGSIRKTFAHLLWGDKIWMSRFAGTDAPTSTVPGFEGLEDDWATYCAERSAFDRTILGWAHLVDPSWFDGPLTWYSGAVGQEVTKPKAELIIQFFNHQTHHRGQIHAMLTAAGARPDDTDLPYLPDRYARM